MPAIKDYVSVHLLSKTFFFWSFKNLQSIVGEYLDC